MKGESGLSLVEMMVAVAIMGLLATLAVLGLKGLGDQGSLKAAASTMVGTLREAQLRAEGQHTCYRVRWDANGTAGRQLYLEQHTPAQLPGSLAPTSPSMDDCVGDAGWNPVRTFSLPDHLTVTLPGCGNNPTIQFDNRGLVPPGSACVDVPISLQSGTGSVSIQLYGATGAVVTGH